MRKKDLSEVAFASDVTFEGALSAKLIGERAVADFLTGLFPAIRHSSQAAHRGREYVATVFDFDTTFGVISVFDSRIQSDRTVELTAKAPNTSLDRSADGTFLNLSDGSAFVANCCARSTRTLDF